jgi:hypothetical protein
MAVAAVLVVVVMACLRQGGSAHGKRAREDGCDGDASHVRRPPSGLDGRSNCDLDPPDVGEHQRSRILDASSVGVVAPRALQHLERVSLRVLAMPAI